jgi:hypothetical protein
MLDRDTLRWLSTLHVVHRLKLKCVPTPIRKVLVQERLARVSGRNLVITAAGVRRVPSMQPRMSSYIYVD